MGNPADNRESGPVDIRAIHLPFQQCGNCFRLRSSDTLPLRTTDRPNLEVHRQPITQRTSRTVRRAALAAMMRIGKVSKPSGPTSRGSGT